MGILHFIVFSFTAFYRYSVFDTLNVSDSPELNKFIFNSILSLHVKASPPYYALVSNVDYTDDGAEWGQREFSLYRIE